jgi:hypothetical protein
MHSSWEKANAIKSLGFVLLVILIAAVPLHARPTAADSNSGRALDLYTQKTPFSGKGMNQSSDAFQPQELVVLYALVTYNDVPVASKLVGFQVTGPPNIFTNITISGSAPSDQDGIANFSFRVPWPNANPEAIVFGQWFAVATVDIAQQTVVDTLTFQVGWIVELTNIATLDSQLKPKTTFSTQDVVVLNLTVKSIALTPKQGAITIDVKDSLSYPIMHIELDNLVFPPSVSYVNTSSLIPTYAANGTATVTAAPYTALPENGGVLYSPAISTQIQIMGKLKITRDVAVLAVFPSKTVATSGETIQIIVTVKNKGDLTESFNVTLYFNDTVIGKKLAANLAPSTQEQIPFEWNTTGVTSGNYVLSAVADTLPGEINTQDNAFVDGMVTIQSVPLMLPFLYFEIFLIFIFLVPIIGSLILLLFLYFIRRRRRKRPTPPRYIVLVHPHV